MLMKRSYLKPTFAWLNRSLLMLYLLYLGYVTLFDKTFGRDFSHRSINIIPFKTIREYLSGTLFNYGMIVNIFGNMAAFFPMGFLVPMVFKKCKSFLWSLTLIIASSVAIEVMQYITGVGASDIDDVILNTVGGIIGYISYVIFNRILYIRK